MLPLSISFQLILIVNVNFCHINHLFSLKIGKELSMVAKAFINFVFIKFIFDLDSLFFNEDNRNES